MNVQQIHEIINGHEVLITLPAPLPESLLRCLAKRPGAPGQVQVLCHKFQEPAYLLSLLRLGFQVFDADIPEEMLVILDRHIGYRLPHWTALTAPFDLACRLLWGRTGAYTRLAGTVASVQQGRERSFWLLTLTCHEHVRIAWHDSQRPKPGEVITVLGRHSFILGSSLPVLIEGIGLWPGEELS